MSAADDIALQRFRQLGGSKAAFAKAKSKAYLMRMEWDGAAGLESALRELGTDQNIRRTLKRAVLEALEPVAKSARSKAPRSARPVRVKGHTIDQGTYAESIDVGVTLSRRQAGTSTVAPNTPTSAAAFVGPKPQGPGVLEEFGTTQRHWRNGKSTGSAPAHPHMRPAWDENKAGVLELLGEMLWVQIAATAKRLAARQAKLLKGSQ
jgi:hypothetical protein